MELEDYIDRECLVEDLGKLFNKIRNLILNQNEKSHNWNKNHIASLVFNEWLIFKKEIAE